MDVDQRRFATIGSSLQGWTDLLGVVDKLTVATQALDHQVVRPDAQIGGYQAILYDAEQDVYYGASESRKDGQAAGY